MLRSLPWIAEATSGRLLPAPAGGKGGSHVSVDVALATTDSRECREGALYFARVGESADGHDFAAQAAQAGATALVVERELPQVNAPQILVEDATVALGALARAHLADLRATCAICVAGVTGSAGKTTTKDLLAAILGRSGPTVAPKLSFNNEVGCPLTILQATSDTRFLVLEMGASGTGHIRYLTEIAPLDVAVELMVGRAHLGGFGSVRALQAAKQELVEGLVARGTAVLNADDPLVLAMEQAAPDRTLTFSAAGAEDATVRATDVKLEDDGCPSFVLETPDFRGRVRLKLAGIHQVNNALAAACCAYALGQSTPPTVKALEEASAASPHRMDVRSGVRVRSVDGTVTVTVIDDAYNANPDSMAASFRAATALGGKNRLVMVLGEMLELGADSTALHRETGQNAAEAAPDVVIAVGDQAGPLLEPLPPTTITRHVNGPVQAEEVLRELICDGDVVLLKGSLGSGVWRVADALVQTA